MIIVPTDKPPALIGPWYDTEKFQTRFTQAKWEVTLFDDDDSKMMDNQWFYCCFSTAGDDEDPDT